MQIIPFCLAKFLIIPSTLLLVEVSQPVYDDVDQCQARHPDMILGAADWQDEYGPMLNIVCGCTTESEARKLGVLTREKI